MKAQTDPKDELFSQFKMQIWGGGGSKELFVLSIEIKFKVDILEEIK